MCLPGRSHLYIMYKVYYKLRFIKESIFRASWKRREPSVGNEIISRTISNLRNFYLEKYRTTAKMDVRIYTFVRTRAPLLSHARARARAHIHHVARVSKWNEISLLFIARASECQRTSVATCRLCRAA